LSPSYIQPHRIGGVVPVSASAPNHRGPVLQRALAGLPAALGSATYDASNRLTSWAREGRLIPNDPDVDFFYAAGDAESFESAIPTVVAAGFEPLYRFANNDRVTTEHSFPAERREV
jgi:hypothetical protein